MVHVGGVATNAVMCRQKALRALGSLPLFSPILSKLLSMMAEEEASFGRLAELIEKDAVLAGNVLRLVNSALYGRRGTISSVRHAVSLMGLNKLRNTVLTLSVAQLWTGPRMPPRWPARRFNLHSVATAVMGDLLAQRTACEYPEGAFVAGLLHDIGLLALATSHPGEFAEVRRLHVEEGLTIEAAERSVFGLDHAEISSAALHKWNLPGPIRRAVGYQFEEEERKGAETPLSWLVRLANQLIEARRMTIFELSGPPPAAANGDLCAVNGVAIDHERLEADFEREFEPIKAFS